jgi:class 3 adenylate cyclase
MPEFPSGTVTFLFTDIEGSTRLWERDRQAMAQAVERHLALLDAAIPKHGGVHFKTGRDAVQEALPTAANSVAAATGRPRPAVVNRLSRACLPQASFPARRHSGKRPRGVLRRGPALHRSSVGAPRRTKQSTFA